MFARLLAIVLAGAALGGCLATASSYGETDQQMSARHQREIDERIFNACGPEDTRNQSFLRCAVREVEAIKRDNAREAQAYRNRPAPVYIERQAPAPAPAPRAPINCSTVYYPLGPQTTCY